jgi:type IV secretory pathway VirB4 component
MADANSQDLIAVKNIRDGTLILQDGTLCQIIMVGGLNLSLRSEMEQNAIIGSYQDFLNSLDFSIQFIVHSRKINIQKYLNLLEKRRSEEGSALLQNQIAEYREFIGGFVKDNAIMRKIFLAVVPYYTSVVSASSGIAGLLPFHSKKPTPQNTTATEEEFQKNLSSLRQRVSQVIEGLHTVGLETKVLEDNELVELLYNFYNPGTVEQEKAM